ncbi:MAG: hypothetical protein ACYSR8_10850 [Planctomycetota bacterium]
MGRWWGLFFSLSDDEEDDDNGDEDNYEYFTLSEENGQHIRSKSPDSRVILLVQSNGARIGREGGFVKGRELISK